MHRTKRGDGLRHGGFDWVAATGNLQSFKANIAFPPTNFSCAGLPLRNTTYPPARGIFKACTNIGMNSDDQDEFGVASYP